MKKFIVPALFAASLLSPALAFADEPNAPMAPPGMEKHAAVFEQVHTKMEALHRQARAQILATLSPAHKALLAQVVGELAISPNPDPAAAARRLNAALTPGESQAIVRTAAQVHTQMRAMMEAARAEIERSMPADETTTTTTKHTEVRVGGPPNEPKDAGSILLMLANSGHEGMGGPHVMMKQVEEHHQ
jgi:hypothetical protein